jgi:hypothetical protein
MGKLYIEENAKKYPFIWRHTGKCALEAFWPAPYGCWIPFGKSPKSIGDLVGNTYRVVRTFWEKFKKE